MPSTLATAVSHGWSSGIFAWLIVVGIGRASRLGVGVAPVAAVPVSVGPGDRCVLARLLPRVAVGAGVTRRPDRQASAPPLTIVLAGVFLAEAIGWRVAVGVTLMALGAPHCDFLIEKPLSARSAPI